MNLIEKLTKSVVDGDSEQAVLLAKEVVKHELDINEVILNGLNEGMRIVVRHNFQPQGRNNNRHQDSLRDCWSLDCS